MAALTNRRRERRARALRHAGGHAISARPSLAHRRMHVVIVLASSAKQRVSFLARHAVQEPAADPARRTEVSQLACSRSFSGSRSKSPSASGLRSRMSAICCSRSFSGPRSMSPPASALGSRTSAICQIIDATVSAIQTGTGSERRSVPADAAEPGHRDRRLRNGRHCRRRPRSRCRPHLSRRTWSMPKPENRRRSAKIRGD